MKKATSIILALIMIFALAIPAFAEDDDAIVVTTTEQFIEAIESSECKTVTIKIVANEIETNESLDIPSDASITIDLNGNDLSLNAIYVLENASLTICNKASQISVFKCQTLYNYGALEIYDVDNELSDLFNYNLASLRSITKADAIIGISNGESAVTFVGSRLKADIFNDVDSTGIVFLSINSIRKVDYDNCGKTYPLDINKNAYISIDELAKVQDAIINKEKNLPLPIPTLDGAEFTRWEDNIKYLPKETRTMMSATFTYKEAVTLDYNDGTGTTQKVDVYDGGTLVNSLPEMDRHGYYFTNWTKNGKVVTIISLFKPGDVLKANWTEISGNEYKIANALKLLGVGQTDIDKMLGIVGVNSLTGSVFTSEPVWGVIIAALMLGCFAGGIVFDRKKNSK